MGIIDGMSFEIEKSQMVSTDPLSVRIFGDDFQ